MVLKNGININERLIRTLSFADKCRYLADIGSDHGYSSIYAVQNNIAERVIATDISKASLDKTEKIVKEYDLSDKIECRVGDGLKVLATGEANAALIAGMGADLIADIIEASLCVAKAFDYMLLQPMNSAISLRKRIIALGFDIREEGIVFENGKFYQILKCSEGIRKNVTDIEYELGFYVYKEKIPLCREYISHCIKHYENIIGYIGKNDTESATDNITQAQNKINEYRKALEWATAK